MKMIKGLLAAAMLVVAPTTVHAKIVTTKTNIAVPKNIDGIYINAVTGATSGAEFGGYDFNPYDNGGGLTFYTPVLGGTVVAVRNGTSSQALDLFNGTIIGPNSVFQEYQVRGDASFRNTGSHNVGFRFLNEGTGLNNYGYFSIDTTAADGFPATVTGWSYEDSGAAIAVGATASAAVPEPATWGMMLLGFGAMGFAMRRRAKVRMNVSFA